MARKPLDFVPAPIPAWRSQLPLIALSAAGFIAFGAARLTRSPQGSHPAGASIAALAETPSKSAGSHATASGSLAVSRAPAGEAPSLEDIGVGSGSPTTPALAAGGSAPVPAAAGAPATDDAPPVGAPAGDGDAALAGGTAPPSPTVGEGDSEAAQQGDGSASAVATSEGAAASDPPAAKPPRTLSPAELRRAERAAAGLRSAVEEGRVKAVADFYALVDVAEQGWDGAASRCMNAEVDGVGHWKLASPSELRTLDRANKLPAGAYWSRTRSRKDPALAVAYDAGQGRSVLWLTQEPNGAVVCTQARPPATP